jgi:hypothetical protein
MSEAPEIAILAEGGMARLKELLRVLEPRGFDAQIIAPPEGKANT